MATREKQFHAGKIKVRKNFKLPADLVSWMEDLAKENNMSLTQLIVDHFTKLKTKSAHVEQI